MEPKGTRERILDEAASLFELKGYTAVSLREIAEKLGFSKAALYYHFPDKEGLLESLLVSAMERLSFLEDLVKDASQTWESYRAGVKKLCLAQLELSPRVRAAMRIHPQARPHLSSPSIQRVEEAYGRYYLLPLHRFFQSGMEKGYLRCEPVEFYLWCFLGLLYPFVNHNVTEEEIPGLAEKLTVLFLSGAEKKI